MKSPPRYPRDLDVPDPTAGPGFGWPDLTKLCQLDDLRLEVVGQHPERERPLCCVASPDADDGTEGGPGPRRQGPRQRDSTACARAPGLAPDDSGLHPPLPLHSAPTRLLDTVEGRSKTCRRDLGRRVT